ncbi:ATP-dependent Clp protease proteolytic subunit [Candidatus Woesearchaeota archaeon]|nr:ATP-dependent Clp protease proteolytic subunit [Candidatus Woesearchaeota archaeon]
MDSLFNKLLKEKPEGKDNIQKDLLKTIQKISGRTTISYISNFRTHPHNMINFDDKTFVTMLVESVKKSDKIDFILHSPGGFAEETEMIVNILRRRFKNIRFIVPHSAKSAATMLAFSGNEILMCPSAELGPIDPQVSGPITAPAQSIIDGFKEIKKMVDDEGKLNGAFVPLLNKMDVATIKRCENAINYGRKMVEDWLKQYMFFGEKDSAKKAQKISRYFSNHNNFLTHAKPITLDMIKKIPEIEHLKVMNIEDVDTKLASLIWEYYCRFEGIMSSTSPVNKIFHSESEYMVNLAPFIQVQNPVQVPQQPTQLPSEEKKK